MAIRKMTEKHNPDEKFEVCQFRMAGENPLGLWINPRVLGRAAALFWRHFKLYYSIAVKEVTDENPDL